MENEYPFRSNKMTIKFCSALDAQAIEPTVNMALISVCSDWEREQVRIDYDKWEQCIRLRFDDMPDPEHKFKLFMSDDARQIIEFVESLPDTVDEIVVNCFFGISRSSAIVRFLCGCMFPDCRNKRFEKEYKIFNKRVFDILLMVWNSKQ